MNKEQAQKAIEILQAFIDGKEIQFSPEGSGKWWNANDPMFSFHDTKYRIKPGPREFWAFKDHRDKDFYLRPNRPTNKIWDEVIKVREELEDD